MDRALESDALPAAGVRESPRHPALFQINTRTWITELSRTLGRPVTLDAIPDAELDRIARLGVDWVWLLSVWNTGPAGQAISRSNPEWRRGFERTLPDLRDHDIGGSGFAITGYVTHAGLGGDAALARLRERLRSRGLRLMLDFVPNHTALDHPWVETHPEYYVPGSEENLARAPQNYTRLRRKSGDMVLAYGRDPYFPGWPDVLQLNYANKATQEAMLAELLAVSARCDGVRCDMAMLLLPEVFERTWGLKPEPFWQKAIEQVRGRWPRFTFMAEVYWDLEWTLQQQGFDYTYDKRLYDRLRDGHARPVRDHLRADFDYQRRMARFLENHDEPRAAATFPHGMHEAAALVTYLTPGLRFFERGQFEGSKVQVSPHLIRAPAEVRDDALAGFYEGLLAVLRTPELRDGEWSLLECGPAWDGNWTSDCFIASLWRRGAEQRLVVVNYAANQSQCYVRLALEDLQTRLVILNDLMGSSCYERSRDDLATRGLYLDLPAWGYHVFEVRPA
jgi:hypothetical protein